MVIDNALELGVTKCLQQLQMTNPDLLLTAQELRKAERDTRYVPAVAQALASIFAKSVNGPDPVILDRIQNWGNRSFSTLPSAVVTLNDQSSHDLDDEESFEAPKTESPLPSIKSISLLIEQQLRFVVSQSEMEKTKPVKKDKLHVDVNDKENERSVASSPDQSIDWGIMQQLPPTSGKTKVSCTDHSDNDSSHDESNFEDWL